MKKLLALLLALVMVFGLVACSDTNDPDGTSGDPSGNTQTPVTLRVASYRSEDEAIYKEIVNRFQTKYSYITVDLDLNPDQTSYYQNLEADLMEGVAPDVFDFHSNTTFVEYAQAGIFLPQDDLSYMTNYQDGAKAISSVDGKNYAFINAYNMLAIFYNKDIFAQEGLSEPTTFEEFATLCKTLQDKGYGGVIYPGSTVGTSWLFNAVMTINLGGPGYKDLIEGMDSGKYTDITTIDGVEEGLKTLQAYYDNNIFYTASEATDLTQAMSLFAQGLAPMMYNGTWSFGTKETDFPDINTGVFAIPTVGNTGENYAESAQLTVINASTKVADAAKLWVEFIASAEISSYYCSSAKMISTIEGVTLDYEGGDVLATLASKGVNLLPTYTRNNKDYWNSTWKALQSDLMYGAKDYDTAITEYVQFLTDLNLANIG